MSIKSPVAVTGMGLLSPLGLNVQSNLEALIEGRCNAVTMTDWQKIEGLYSHVANIVGDFDSKKWISRDKRRTMSKMSEMACMAALEALQQSQLRAEDLADHRAMMIVGSTSGSPVAYSDSLQMYHETRSARGQLATTVFKCMNSSVAANLAHFLQFKGPVLSPSSACSTSTQAIVLGAQLIQSGACDIVIAGGADECHSTSCLSFDVAYAASRKSNLQPQLASRPFDKERDGIVVSEGASIVILESESSRIKRGVMAAGKILGGSYYCDGSHMVHPSTDSIQLTMEQALNSAGLAPADISYVNAHATSTVVGDLAEAKAISQVFGHVPVSSFKGHFGHTFAACGGLELILSIEMMKKKILVGTHNLMEVDPQLPDLDYLSNIRNCEAEFSISNNFAFGGMNASVVFSN